MALVVLEEEEQPASRNWEEALMMGLGGKWEGHSAGVLGEQKGQRKMLSDIVERLK